jgi:hypothetical protein
VLGEVLLSEIKKETYDSLVDVEKVRPLNHICGEDYVVGGKRIKYKR